MDWLADLYGAVDYRQLIMLFVGAALIWLATARNYEPNLLLPMGFGTILVNLPLSSAITRIAEGSVQVGALSLLFDIGISTELFPLLIFIAVGAMIDFTPLLTRR